MRSTCALIFHLLTRITQDRSLFWELCWYQLLPAYGTLFLLLGCLKQPWYEGLCLFLLHLVQLIFLGGLLFFWRETEEQWFWGRGVEAGLGEVEKGGCRLDLLCARRIKEKRKKNPENWRNIIGATDSLPVLLERYFQSPCNWDLPLAQTLPQIVKNRLILIIPNKCMLNEWTNA